jgi:hypothetical protein
MSLSTYVYAAIGVAAFVALLIFRYVTDRIDRKSVQYEMASTAER